MEETGNAERPVGMHPSFVGVIRQKERLKEKLSNISHKIGVYSAKGGVGKTTVAVNIAYTLAEMGFRVGLLDADIDTPNVALFVGSEDKFDTSKMPLKPVEKYGVKIASTSMLATNPERPIIWRGPMMVKMLGEFFENTDWGNLDYLILDLPPGSSDTPLTIMQVLDLDGFVIVTTPQRIASINSIRSGIMAKKLNIAILGVVENMSDGSESKSTRDVISALDTGLLGVVKLDGRFNSYSDTGKVPVLEDDEIYKTFEGIVIKLPGSFDGKGP
ncbi:MAG: P-loop NTPase [Candidatus Micrarchaeota archaeon]|nr:P-loop NTPase [Candidatus Micrarchaeota archaeon]